VTLCGVEKEVGAELSNDASRPKQAGLSGPFFEIGPKNLLRRAELEGLARAAGAAGFDYGVSVILTVPTALIAPVHDLHSGVLPFAQAMAPDPPGDSMGRVIAETLVDAGAAGVMLNHVSNPLDAPTLAATVERAHSAGLQTIVCVNTTAEAVHVARLGPTAILLEPPALIGTAGRSSRDWISPANAAVRRVAPAVLMMHAGGVSAPSIAEAIMASGADGTGSTSGVIGAKDPLRAARSFIAATRVGWDSLRQR
jgi:triosephosphate isomerase (TIM)